MCLLHLRAKITWLSPGPPAIDLRHVSRLELPDRREDVLPPDREEVQALYRRREAEPRLPPLGPGRIDPARAGYPRSRSFAGRVSVLARLWTVAHPPDAPGLVGDILSEQYKSSGSGLGN